MDRAARRIRESGTALEVALHVQPRARRTLIAGLHDGALKVKIAAPPVDDAANRALIEFFSRLFSLPKTRLHIVSGDKSRDKILRIESFSLKDLQEHLPDLFTD